MSEHDDMLNDETQASASDISSPLSPPFVVASIWGEPQFQFSARPHSISVGRAGSGLSFIFDDLLVELNTPDRPLTATAILTLRAPLTPDANREFLGYFVKVNGAAIKDSKSRASLLIDAGGATRTLDFPYGEERGLTTSAVSGPYTLEMFSIERLAPAAQFADGRRPPLPPCAVSLLLTAQRISTDETVILTIDTLSIEAIQLR